ncbi:hypothetical protein M422DRAFT_38652 [Sphaerobolus stellatus SS14]|uniref:Uncharacterized protein n=1 Tax=Sphaerobolus stellatus (strain SS14) TaxID=990650 RepID=A0A0C9T8W7_SPHS4|nr:hypothetical protein M422DRAFT_38652 [Sphaerobolus stellatus SS14]
MPPDSMINGPPFGYYQDGTTQLSTTLNVSGNIDSGSSYSMIKSTPSYGGNTSTIIEEESISFDPNVDRPPCAGNSKIQGNFSFPVPEANSLHSIEPNQGPLEGILDNDHFWIDSATYAPSNMSISEASNQGHFSDAFQVGSLPSALVSSSATSALGEDVDVVELPTSNLSKPLNPLAGSIGVPKKCLVTRRPDGFYYCIYCESVLGDARAGSKHAIKDLELFICPNYPRCQRKFGRNDGMLKHAKNCTVGRNS